MTMLLDRADYVLAIILFLIGLYALVAKSNLIKKIIGLNIMETAVFIFIITGGLARDGSPPLVTQDTTSPYHDPVSQTIVLVGIVVAVSVTALALSLVTRIHAEHGTIEADELRGGR